MFRRLTRVPVACIIFCMTPLLSFIGRRSPALMSIFSIVALFITACALPAPSLPADSVAQTDTIPPIVSVITEGDGNRATAVVDDDILTIEVNSARGMGSAAIALADGDMPAQVILQFHLDGLERLQVTTTEATVVAEVSSSAPAESIQHASISPEDTRASEPVAPNNPLWLTITPPGDSHDFFLVNLPPELLQNTDRTLHIEWVDFYR